MTISVVYTKNIWPTDMALVFINNVYFKRGGFVVGGVYNSNFPQILRWN